MQFSTKVEITPSSVSISHRDKIALFGSCFAENIGEKLRSSKFDINLNPFGILYNPLSISQSINRLIDNIPFRKDELVEHKGIFHSFWHHGRFSATDPERALKQMNNAFSEAYDYLREADFLLITFGTAYVYKLCKDNMIVGNCHKFPASNFERSRLQVGSIVEDWGSLLDRLRAFNPKLKVLFTVSPIRHLKDGAHNNQLSKSILLLAIDQLMQQHPSTGYFPSYELVIDELRDYRFYADDMIHPSSKAVDYIWQRFSDTYFSAQTTGIIKEWNQIASAIAHRPFNERGEEYKHFLNLSLNKIALFKEKYPYICCSSEQSLLTNKLEEIQ